jgi:hypothetical protein
VAHDSFGEPPGSFGICFCFATGKTIQFRFAIHECGVERIPAASSTISSEAKTWRIAEAGVRDPDWRPMYPDEATLASREIGSMDYTLNYYGDQEPYYWRYKQEGQN